MTEAEQKLLDAAREHWITGKYNHLIAAVNAERTDGDVLVRMPAQQWRWLTDALRPKGKSLQLGRRAWMAVATIEAELPTREPKKCRSKCGVKTSRGSANG